MSDTLAFLIVWFGALAACGAYQLVRPLIVRRRIERRIRNLKGASS